MLAEASVNYAWFATMPLWPLAGALLTGLMICLRMPRDRAHWPVVIGAGVSAALAAWLFVMTLSSASGHQDADAHADAKLGAAPIVFVAQHGDEGNDAAAAQPDSAQPAAAAHGDPAIVADHAAPGPKAAPTDAHNAGKHAVTYHVYDWIPLRDMRNQRAETWHAWIPVNFFFDSLTGVMMFVVCFIAFLVIVYSIGYKRDHHGHAERGYERFFAFLGLFVFSMGMLVLGGNFVMLYLGWELVGLSSYLLIGFYYGKESAAAAAKKAFIVNRIGDLGFALGIFAIYSFIQPYLAAGENPLDYEVVFRHFGAFAAQPIEALGGLTKGAVVGLLLLCGALGKSAQFPLYIWLPDAMEGPSPVSALIHAATMVTAGVYMIARCGVIFTSDPIVAQTIIVIGLIGALLAATMAMAQYDMKRILAYSTMSQLAYMFVGLGVGASDSAIFHLYTHAFFKALLFLCAGSVMHQMGNVIDLRHFSGLRKILPQTQKLMLIGCLALAGFPLLAGFWSKDEIIHAAFERADYIGILLLITAGLTAYYTFRMYFLCFHGETRTPVEAGDHPHESPPVMIRPLYVLAFGAIFAGYLGVHVDAAASSFLFFLAPHGVFHHALESSTIVKADIHHGSGIPWLMYISAAIAIAGIGLAYMRYGAAPQQDPDKRALGPLWAVWHAKYWMDEIFNALFAKPLRALGELCFRTDRNTVDGVVNLAGAAPDMLGRVARLPQKGALQTYALGMAVGVGLLLVVWTWLDRIST